MAIWQCVIVIWQRVYSYSIWQCVIVIWQRVYSYSIWQCVYSYMAVCL